MTFPTLSEIEAMQRRIRDLETVLAERWIEVDQRSPSVGEEVLFRFADGRRATGMRTAECEHWNYRQEPDQRIVAWMPLPPSEPRNTPRDRDTDFQVRYEEHQAQRRQRVQDQLAHAEQHLEYIRSSRLWKIEGMAFMGLGYMDCWEHRYLEDVPFLMALLEKKEGCQNG